MAKTLPPRVIHRPVPFPVDHGPVIPPPAVQRVVIDQTRQAAQTTPPHPAVWQPWTTLAAQAESQLKAEISAALKAYEMQFGAAGRILDTAYGMATEQAGQLQAAAWAAFNRYMAAADATSRAILEPATTAYDQAVSNATAAYAAALGEAEKTYRQVMADVNRAKTDGTTTAA